MRIQLGELIRSGVLELGDGYRTKRSELSQFGYAIVRAGDVVEIGVTASDSEFVDQRFDKAIGRKTVRLGDVVITTKGTVGRVAEVSKVPNAGLAVYSPQVCYLRSLQPSILHQRYLKYLLMSPATRYSISTFASSSDMAPYLSLSDFKSMVVDLPSLEDQRAIADVLGALDDKIAANQRVLAIESQLFAALWQYSSYKGIEKKHLSDLVKTQYGFTASAGVYPGSPKFLRVKDINKQKWIEWQSVPEVDIAEKDFEKYRLNRNDIVVARMADPGKSAIIDSDIRAVFASYLVRLTPHNRDDALYIYGFLNSNIYENYTRAVSTGSVQRNMNARVITDVDIPWPSREVRLDFAETGGKIRSAMGTLVKENQVLAATRDELLPLLMNGKITVAEAKEAAGDVGVVKQNQQEEGDGSV
ncbi:restriction endonuclease subunit S [Corynebacterium diphtheriae]|nr:restriction endonuclease subunit S [Corynebacterium diphtheriae]CAB1016083.1 restriction endonuclease subunit S [Corynebacterium diphtheriae]CAB1025230.1 restriction endonuclease subunit S [Corynebacterium diphtheriae]